MGSKVRSSFQRRSGGGGEGSLKSIKHRSSTTGLDASSRGIGGGARVINGPGEETVSSSRLETTTHRSTGNEQRKKERIELLVTLSLRSTELTMGLFRMVLEKVFLSSVIAVTRSLTRQWRRSFPTMSLEQFHLDVPCE